MHKGRGGPKEESTRSSNSNKTSDFRDDSSDSMQDGRADPSGRLSELRLGHPSVMVVRGDVVRGDIILVESLDEIWQDLNF